MFKSISAAIVGSIIVFFWGFLSWMVMDWHKTKNFEDSSKLAALISQHAPEHGIYSFPSKREGKEIDAEAIAKGPFIYAVVRPSERLNFSMPRSLVGSWMTALMGSVALAAMMQMGANCFSSRALIGVFAAFFLAVTTAIPALNWFEYPLAHAQAMFLDAVISWTLAGLTMAYILSFKGKKAPSEPSE